MTAFGHVIFSIAISILAKKIGFSNVLRHGIWAHIIIGALFSCLLPDIDHPKSYLGSKIKYLSKILFDIFGHRKFTHSFLAIILFILVNYKFISNNIMPIDLKYSMILAYISHIIADIFTPSGIPLFWPMKYRFKIPIINPNKNLYAEKIFCLLLLVISLMYPIKIKHIFKIFYFY